MYNQLLAEAIDRERLREATRRRRGEQALRIARTDSSVSEAAPLWQRPLNVLRRPSAANLD